MSVLLTRIDRSAAPMQAAPMQAAPVHTVQAAPVQAPESIKSKYGGSKLELNKIGEDEIRMIAHHLFRHPIDLLAYAACSKQIRSILMKYNDIISVSIGFYQLNTEHRKLVLRYTQMAFDKGNLPNNHRVNIIFERGYIPMFGTLVVSELENILDALADTRYPAFCFANFYDFATGIVTKSPHLFSEREANLSKRAALLNAAEQAWGPDHASRPPKCVYDMRG